MVAKLVGASVWEEELFEHLTSHEDAERELLKSYQESAIASGSEAFRYLASLIIDDEIRHHRMFQELAESLRTDAEFRSEKPAVPRLDSFGPNRGVILKLTEQMLGQERADARELRRLGRELKDVADTTLWRLLVRMMEMDTQKHIEILEFVRRQARSNPGR